MIPRFLPALFISIGLPLCAEDPAPDAFARWAPDIAAFATRDAAAPPAKGALLFVGSSSIRMWDLKASWPGRATINNGFGGSTLADSIHYFEQLFAPYKPGAVILYAGDNDINKGLSAAEVAADFTTLATAISTSFPKTPVVYLAIKPSQARWELWPEMKAANDLIAAQCHEHESWYFADTAAPMLAESDAAPPAKWFIEDGLHLSPFGYREWTRVVNEVLTAAAVQP